MISSADNSADKQFVRRAVEAAIRIGLIALLVAWCFDIVRPFIVPLLWGIIIAVACMPMFRWSKARLGDRNKLAATVFTLIALAIVITPTVMLGNSLAVTAHTLNEDLKDGTLTVPPPPEGVETWPVVGKELGPFWTDASQNLVTTLKKVEPQLKELAVKLLSVATGAGLVVLQFIVSIIIAGVLLANAGGCDRVSKDITRRLVGDRGDAIADTAAATVRSVAQGVLGVAFIQSLLAGIGMLMVGVPAAGFWALLVLLLAIIQLPPILILLPVALYVFGQASTTVAVAFLIYAIVVSASDAFLKPLFLGRGMETPMLIILIGAIGGMMASGIIGLFVGAVILALGYELFMAWLREEPQAAVAGPETTSES
jgi:predicted PurR-regulated permease PerM